MSERRWAGCFRFLATIAAGSALAAAPLGCGDDSEGSTSGGGSGVGVGNGAGPQATVDVEVGAPGVTLRQVAIYQGVRRSLMIDGSIAPSSVPMVAGRDATVRVFYQASAEYDGEQVTVRLTWNDGEVMEIQRSLFVGSNELDLATTFQFEIPAARMTAGPLAIKVELLQTRALPADEADAPDVSPARWSSEGALDVRGSAKPFRVKLVPFRYDADGSGRLPDTSDQAVESYRSYIEALFPVSDVEVTVRDAVPWSSTISAQGNGWGEVLDAIYDLRWSDGPEDDVYYYGIFNPEADFGGYCQQGCVLGLTYLNNQPADRGSVDLRMAVGVGYVDAYAQDTAAHELGHALGREHAPCGNPDSVDPSYPYAGGSIGVRGMEAGTHVVHSPDDETDFMGYCNKVWISDYNWSAIFDRLEGTTFPQRLDRPAPRPALRLRVDGEGTITSHAFTRVDPRAAGGRVVMATLTGAHGVRSTVQAHVLGYDHIEGVTVLVPGADASTRRVELTLDGRALVLSL